MSKQAVEITIPELEGILEKYCGAAARPGYAVKIEGSPGVGKSALVRQVAEKLNYYFIDTRLAFKENVDLGGYPVPDHEARRMVYFRPRFIPPPEVPKGYNGILWFLDEANRAHPTVIQTLFQIITDNICGEHELPDTTAIVLAGNLGEADRTTITDFDDSALDGRLALFHLKPAVEDWLAWAETAGIHGAIRKYITMYPGELWKEEKGTPNPRAWHQVSQALKLSWGFEDEESLLAALRGSEGAALEKMIASLVGEMEAHEFISHLKAPRQLTVTEVLNRDAAALEKVRGSNVPVEDLLWVLSGALEELKNTTGTTLTEEERYALGSMLLFVGEARADTRVSFFFRLIREGGFLTQMPAALATVDDERRRQELLDRFDDIINPDA